MAAYLVLFAAALSRLFPHAMHGVGLNFTAVGGGLLYFGARRSRAEALFAALLLACTDIYLTLYAYGFPFHVRGYLLTWLWYATVCLLGSAVLQRASVGRVLAAGLASATSFFLLSNAAVWASGGMYPHTAPGLGACYVAALPFYGNDLLSTALTCGVLFGLPVVARRMREAMVDGRRTQPFV